MFVCWPMHRAPHHDDLSPRLATSPLAASRSDCPLHAVPSRRASGLHSPTPRPRAFRHRPALTDYPSRRHAARSLLRRLACPRRSSPCPAIPRPTSQCPARRTTPRRLHRPSHLSAPRFIPCRLPCAALRRPAPPEPTTRRAPSPRTASHPSPTPADLPTPRLSPRHGPALTDFSVLVRPRQPSTRRLSPTSQIRVAPRRPPDPPPRIAHRPMSTPLRFPPLACPAPTDPPSHRSPGLPSPALFDYSSRLTATRLIRQPGPTRHTPRPAVPLPPLPTSRFASPPV